MKFNLFIKILIFLSLFTISHTQQKDQSLHHWNLYVSGGITRFFSNNIYGSDSTRRNLNMDLNYIEYVIGYRPVKSHEVYICVRNIPLYHHFLRVDTLPAPAINGTSRHEGDIIKFVLEWAIGYKLIIVNKKNKEYSIGFDFGSDNSDLDEIIFNLSSGISIPITSALFFNSTLNFCQSMVGGFFKNNNSQEIRLNLGVILKL